MHSYLKILAVSMLSVLVLGGCNGDSPYGDAATDDGDTTTPDDNAAGTQGKSYLPLNVYEAYSDYSGYEQDGVFRGEYWRDATGIDALIPAYLINPVDAATVSSITTAAASDYKVTVDDVEIDSTESFPILQKVIGTETALTTALVFDLSNSVSDVDMEALVAEAKAYIVKAQNSADPAIRGQYFVVWAFGQDVTELTTGFTRNRTTLNAALDQVLTHYNSRDLGAGSNLHRAVVEAVGGYENETDGYHFRDPVGGPYNDLFDYAGSTLVQLSQMVVFSSGPDSFLEFSKDEMTRAIESQSFLKYDPAVPDASSMIYLKKPVFYYIVGGTVPGAAYSTLSDLSEAASNLVLTGGAYNFEDDLIAKQQAAIDKRIDLDNQYLYRFAMIPRVGAHTVVFASKSTGNNYSLTTTYTEEAMAAYADVGTPEEELSSLVEITGPNGEYIAGNDIHLSQASTFAPATRWTTETYDAGDYTWELSGGTGHANANGTFTVTAVSGTATLTLTNDARSDSAIIEIVP